MIVTAAGNIMSSEYAGRVADLSNDPLEIEGVLNVRDILHGPEEMEHALENEFCVIPPIEEVLDATLHLR